ncbi:hypothetical protein RR42_s1415 [Cupriavidus basilensis]|uniref:Uncharacterized protein n=1 Tax=Cupriavidus basilensis TaxID=68895 RepID=A0A0C4YIY3_9BURK|nr:hypothetical protein RR42_s1415 [Cupriavidus basilensis]
MIACRQIVQCLACPALPRHVSRNWQKRKPGLHEMSRHGVF